MITDAVIKEIYKTHKHPPKKVDDLELDKFLSMLNTHHKLVKDDCEVINEDLESFNPFKRFLVKSLYGIAEFERHVAFVFSGHILFFDKDSSDMQVHFKPYKKGNFLSRLFRR